MTLTTGAWIIGGYKHGDVGTLGESLSSDSDNRGWAIRAWKYELNYLGLRGAMVLDLPNFGGAMVTQVKVFQKMHGLAEDGVIGPLTGKQMLLPRIYSTGGAHVDDLRGIVAHESTFDLGAIGSVDPGDRGPTQAHLTTGGPVNLSQAIRPALAIPRLHSQLDRLSTEWDEDAAVVSWNCGESGAEWWFKEGKPTTGSPSWWPYGDLGARATAYLSAVRRAATQ